VYHKDRLTHPLKRIGPKGSGKWEKISWDDALDYTAERLKKIRDIYKPKEVAFVRGGSKGLSDGYLVRFANIFGSPNVASATSVCYTPSFMASMVTYGFYAYPDYDYPPACILLWGSNPETTHPSVYQKIRQAIKNGLKIIVIDPAKNRLTGKAEVWLRPKPGTDLALALGMLKVILDEDLLDHRFVHDWTIGLDKLKRQLDGLSLGRIAEITWINQKFIQKAA
jgi:thiosulfate reductase/polysulfide reductase chain A